ncbi:hypothetical protein XELAEV_18042516mg [Xenopus laevis]|uniref:Uncharacterized protein n=1 Tax=Xenopus laevis TaxID=8355 RepID=A0A974H641_XENLA|nr:hypothetical protein XELAEV_18042516mg [Xenopus laevis]
MQCMRNLCYGRGQKNLVYREPGSVLMGLKLWKHIQNILEHTQLLGLLPFPGKKKFWLSDDLLVCSVHKKNEELNYCIQIRILEKIMVFRARAHAAISGD